MEERDKKNTETKKRKFEDNKELREKLLKMSYNFCNNMLKIRTFKGKSQEKFAEEIDVSVATIKQYEGYAKNENRTKK